MVAGVATRQTPSERVADHLGVGEGQRYRRGRVMPVEGRTLTSERIVKKGRSGDWR
jgi:hypothetical protein